MAEAEAAGAHRRFAPRHRLFLGMHYRFAVEQLSRQLTPDAFGRPVTGTARWMRDRFVPASPTFIDPQHSGGGVLFDLGVHLFDTVWVLAGRPEPTWVDAVVSNEVARATAVHGWGDYRRDAMNVDGHAKLSLRFDGGSGPDLLVDLEAAFAVNWPGPDGGSAGAARPRELASIELSGTLAGVALGLAVSDAPPASPRLVRERDGMLVEESLPGLPPPPRCYELQMEHYRRALLGEEEPMTGPDDAVRQMRVVAAAVRSAQTRRPIEITSI
jgi:predicted dehydrogenase